jgi:predicted nucleic acid-binding protein
LTACVLDASVAAKWYLPARTEPLAAEARQLLREHAAGRIEMSVPDLFWPELANVLWKAVRLGRITAGSARESIQSFDHLNITVVPSRPLIAEAFAIAHSFDRTVYDCIYVALALAIDAPLLTADERLANALAARFPIRWLGAAVPNP